MRQFAFVLCWLLVTALRGAIGSVEAPTATKPGNAVHPQVQVTQKPVNTGFRATRLGADMRSEDADRTVSTRCCCRRRLIHVHTPTSQISFDRIVNCDLKFGEVGGGRPGIPIYPPTRTDWHPRTTPVTLCNITLHDCRWKLNFKWESSYS